MLVGALTAVKEKADYFSQLDAVNGDGDHGTAIVSALKSAVDSSHEASEFKTMFNDIGFGVMLSTSGATSTLFGGFFLGMAEEPAVHEIDAVQLKRIFQLGMEGVAKNTRATIGDKTIMDALIPAVEAIVAYDSDDINEILSAGATAARKGAEATVAMKANFGRARNYGERSIGVADAGASSWATIFDAFSKSI